MGVVNVTPDSFSDGGQWYGADAAIARGLELAAQGADIVDVGGESTRPGAQRGSADEELRRGGTGLPAPPPPRGPGRGATDRAAGGGAPARGGARRGARTAGGPRAPLDGSPRPFAGCDDATVAVTALAAAAGAWCARVHEVPANADAVRVGEAWREAAGQAGEGG